MPAPTVSVIIIFYNAGEFFTEAVQSVLNQTASDWELLLVNDGSTDGTDERARCYAAAEPARIRYLEHPDGVNLGMSATRNLGIRAARGEFICLLDADDAWMPEIIERQLAILQSQPEAAMVYGPVLRWYGWTGKQEDQARDFVARPLDDYDCLLEPPELIRHILAPGVGVPLGVMLRKQAILAVGGYENEFKGMCEDRAFFCKLCLCFPVYVASTTWYRYRQHAQSCVAMSRGAYQRNLSRLVFYKWFQRYLKRQNHSDPVVWGYLRDELWAVRVTMLRRRFSGLASLPAELVSASPNALLRRVKETLFH